ncbi:hypothetical protein DL95DRAFT_402809 [Leptodontidium sp. 2 PMI_412]|nr:hypothetical protein DL95DRAFT_402809 [Leptodontidium sp. 2 PMI_412]
MKTGSLITQWQAAQSQLTHNIHPDGVTFANTIVPFVAIENSINIHTPILTLYEMTSTRLDVGKASNEVRKLPDEFKSERMKDRGLFELIDAVRMREEEDVDPESRRLVERMHRGTGSVILPLSSRGIGLLDVAPKDVLSNLELGQGENEGKVKINLDDYGHCEISTFVKDSETRKKFEFATSNKCVQNVPLLKEVVVLRAEAAKLLGYESHAALRLEDRMAMTPETVIVFLGDLRSRLVGSGKEELDKLKELKRKDLEGRGDSFDNRFYPWDYAFYNRQLVKEEYSVDMKKVEEYFEVHTTVQKMLKTFEELFGLQFHDIGRQDAVAWDENAMVYSTWDEEALGGEFLGYLYLDLFDRESKDSGIFICTLEPGFVREDGTRHYPSTVLFCSFSKPTSTRPCLLSQFNLVMLFHELGHGIHNLVSKTKYSRLHGTNTVVDFGQAPSQMLENWCWTPSFLKSLGQHYSYTSLGHLAMWKGSSTDTQPPEIIPDEMVTGIVGSKYCGEPSFLLGQDTETAKSMDLTREYNEMVREIQMFNVPRYRADWASPFVLSSHFMEEYDAGCYSYLLRRSSQVYSTDIFYSAFAGDLTNRAEGRRYWTVLLEKGGSQDEMKTLKEFLGRDPSIEPFYKDLALD